MIIAPAAPAFAEIFIDESSQSKHRYLVLGGIIIDLLERAEYLRELWERRLPELPASEMKWVKVSALKLPAYRRVVDQFFEPRYWNGPHFHSLYVDTTRQRHGVYNQGSREIGFNKEVYQLAMKCGMVYGGNCFHIYPDNRATGQRTEDLRLMLNRGIRKKGDKRDWPFRRVQFRDSKTTELLQLADIFSGAIAFHLNGHRALPGASPAKCELSDYILARAGIQNVVRGTYRTGKFTIWPRRLQS